MDIITIIILLVLVILTFAYVIKSKIIGVLAISLKFGFPVFLVATLIALFIPSIFDFSADFVLRQNGTYSQITSLDKSFSPILELPSSIFDGIGNIFGGNEEPESTEDDLGVLEKNLYPGIVSTTSGVMRILTIFISLSGMVVMIYMNYVLEGSLTAHRLKSKIAQLEERIIHLEGAKRSS